MLRSFRFANHRSFRDEHELLLLPAYDKGRAALPVTALYGANASGKSTVVDALRFLREAVVNSYPRWEPDEGVPRTPFKLDPRGRTDPSLYVVDVLVGGVRHVYGFSVDDERVREEWLYTYPRGRQRVLFERNGDTLEFGPSLTGPKSAVEELIRPNALVLSLASRLRLPAVLPTYEWVRRSVRIGGWRSPYHLAEILRTNRDRAEQVRGLLGVADLGIRDLQIEAIESPFRFGPPAESEEYGEELASSAPARRTRPELRFAHGHGEDAPLLSFAEESRGTQRWLGLLVPALEALEMGTVLVVDEIDSSLHPLLVAQLVGMFRSEQTNPDGAQLLFTAHDTSLMGTALGEDVLARDQIWFVEKDPDGASKIFPLTDFHPRKGENPERRYLGGSYGAVPVLGDPDEAVHGEE